MKRKITAVLTAIFALSLLFTSCSRQDGTEVFSETATSPETVTVSQTSAVSITETSAETVSSETTAEFTEETTAAPAPKSEEQLALEALIDERAGGMTAGEICLPVFGDFDKDGINELIAIYGSTDPEWNDTTGEVWFASGNDACMVFKSYRYLEPKVVESQGRYFIKMEACNISDSMSAYCELKNSTALVETAGFTGCQGLYPDDVYGDFTYAISTYDAFTEVYDGVPNGTGHTWKGEWAYLVGNDIIRYAPMPITMEQFLEYDDAQAVLDAIQAENGSLGDILKRGNGIISVNYRTGTDEFRTNSFRILKYRNGTVYDITDKVNFDDSGIYWGEDSSYIRPDFEILSEKLYDSVEGNEYDKINARLCGDFDGDGKNELFAVYGKGGSVGRLYFVNENGAFMLGNEAEWTDPKIVTVDGTDLVYAEMLAASDSVSYYWQVIDGKPYRIDSYGLMELTQNADNDSEFTAFHTTYDVYTDGTGRSWKPYYFYTVNNDGKISFREYYAIERPSEEIPDYIELIKDEQGYDLKPYLDEISEKGEITSLINRTELGIIHINYMVGNERRYCTLKLKDGTINDVTPENNKGHYIRQVTSKYLLDVIIY